MTVPDSIVSLVREAREAVAPLAEASIGQRDDALRAMAEAVRADRDRLMAANEVDLAEAAAAGKDAAFLDRLRLDDRRIDGMASALDEVASLPSPLGRIDDVRERPNGLKVGRMRIPIGVIAIIYEARPNVTSDAASLCLKAGNTVILKGGRNAQRSNEAIVGCLRRALRKTGLPAGSVQLFSSSDREEMAALLTLDELIDLVIPRGGEGLIRFVAEHSRIPVLKHYKGVCHVYLDRSADVEMAVDICTNAKVQRPSVCNAMETLLVDRAEAERLLVPVAQKLVGLGVTLHACEASRALLAAHGVPAQAATDEDYYAEYLSLDLAVRLVDGLDDAITHIRRYGSDHTEAIVTRDHAQAMRFLERVDSSCVMVNASTRFADGGQLGMGAEIGISTTKLHAYGPMGLEELTARKFVVFGDGQVRQ
jgi:glutamate-5-semialdehyde dehydrogenase